MHFLCGISSIFSCFSRSDKKGTPLLFARRPNTTDHAHRSLLKSSIPRGVRMQVGTFRPRRNSPFPYRLEVVLFCPLGRVRELDCRGGERFFLPCLAITAFSRALWTPLFLRLRFFFFFYVDVYHHMWVLLAFPLFPFLCPARFEQNFSSESLDPLHLARSPVP